MKSFNTSAFYAGNTALTIREKGTGSVSVVSYNDMKSVFVNRHTNKLVVKGFNKSKDMEIEGKGFQVKGLFKAILSNKVRLDCKD